MRGKIEISKQRYNTTQMTDMNSLATALLAKPAEISAVMTHLGGREDALGSKRFPLTMLTEGVGNVKSIDSLEYEYKYTTRVKHARPVAQTPADTSALGIGGRPFTLSFSEKYFINQYVLISESGVQARIMGEPVATGSGFEYTLRLVSPDPAATMPAADVQAGKLFAQMFAPVGVDFSRGNASNWSVPSKIKAKLTTIRKSYQMSGNARDFVVAIDLPTKNGGTSRYWMDYEEWQKYLQWKEEMETLYWYAEQSYGDNGDTHLRDENGQPIIIGPGLLQQIPNVDSYAELTTNKIKNVVGDLFYGMTDAQNKNITLYTGTGGMREFDEAMKRELTGFRQVNDGKFVSGSGRDLTLTGFFTAYEHPDGHTVRVVNVPMFDHGPVAEARAKHPKTGYSLESYRMVFVDNSTYDGEPNIVMVNKKEREMIRWAVAGSVIPRGFTGNNLRASDIDGAAVHYLKTGGVCLRRFDTSLDLQCVAS